MSELPANLPKWIADHIELYRTDPDKAHWWDSSLGGGKGMLPTLLLTTIGRKSGKPRPLPLIYKKVGDSYVIIASKGGAPDHPSWYLHGAHRGRRGAGGPLGSARRDLPALQRLSEVCRRSADSSRRARTQRMTPNTTRLQLQR